MSARAYRRLLENRGDPLLTLQTEKNLNQTESGEDEDREGEVDNGEESEPSTVPAFNPFHLLGGGDVDDEDGEEEDDVPVEPVNDKEPSQPPGAPAASKKLKNAKKKKKGSATNATIAEQQKNAPQKVKGKGKGKMTSAEMEDMSLEEFEKALKEVTEQFGEDHKGAVEVTPSTRALQDREASLLGVEPRMLDADMEMRRIFGSRVMTEEIRRKQYKRGVKSSLAIPRENWPKMEKHGMSMDLLETMDGRSYFAFIHSAKYQEIQEMFFQCVATHDPNTIAHLLQRYPYHIDALLQMSEVFKHSGDHLTAGEFIERVLFAFEKSFHSMFNVALGTCRLDYHYEENRAFFLALHRHGQFLGRRGCWRTAFEFQKMLLALDPDVDALGALLAIDYYALKSREYKWFLQLCEEWWEDKILERMPNIVYSRALAQFQQELEAASANTSGEKIVDMEKHSKSSALLQYAILVYPYVIEPLYEKCGIPLEAEVAGNPYFMMGGSDIGANAEKYLKLLVDLYVERAFTSWKEPEVLTWLRLNIEEAVIRARNEKDEDVSVGREIRKIGFGGKVPLNVSRHVVVSDFNNLFSSLPADILHGHAYDPLPPRDTASSYEEGYTGDTSTSSRFPSFSSMFPMFRFWPQTELSNGQQDVSEQGGEDRAPGADVAGTSAEAVRNMATAVARTLPQGLFPRPTLENPNPEWIGSLQDTIARLFRPNAAPTETADSNEEGSDSDSG